MVRRSKRLQASVAVSTMPEKTVVASKKAAVATPAPDASHKVSDAEKNNAKLQRSAVPKSVRPIRGRCKSGRPWKKTSLVRTNPRSMRVDPKRTGKLAKLTPFEVRERKKRKRDRMRQIQSDIIEERKRRKRAERAAREEKERKRADAQWRNGKLQIITNANKIKKMSKRQLRQLRKMSVDADGTKRLVNPWTGEAYD